MDAFSCRKLSVTRQGREILTEVSCDIPKGQFTAIIGPNGAGKSTLLRCLAGLEEEGKRHVWLGERSLASFSPLERAQFIAWSPESFHVPFAFSVWDIIMMGAFPRHKSYPKNEDKAYVNKMLAMLGLGTKKENSLATLSSGELRKVMLARVLAQRTPLVLLDEPCANLDLAATLEVLSFLRYLTQKYTTVCACIHDIMLAKRFADYVVLLKDGRQIISGPAREVLNEDVIAENFQVKVRFYDSPEGELMSVRLKAPQQEIFSFE